MKIFLNIIFPVVFSLILIFSLIMNICIPAVSIAAETLICDICSKEIESKYYKFKDPASDKFEISICEDCYEAAPRCEACGGYMSKSFKFGGKNICIKCRDHFKDSPICKICGLNIIGAYVKYSDPVSKKAAFVCDDCRKKNPECSLCGIPCTHPAFIAGKRLCENCAFKAASAPVCKICKNPILSSYIHYRDKKNQNVIYVCDSCVEKNDKCFVCGVPDDCLKLMQGRQVCALCLKNLKKCYGCFKYIFKLSYKYELTENIYCADCQYNTDKCDVCGLPTGVSPVRLSDGRKICVDCESTAVKDIVAVHELYHFVAEFLKNEYGMYIGAIDTIDFKEINEMKILGQKTPTADKDVIPLGIFSRNGKKIDIFVQKNLPRNLLIGVLAHEYAHAFVHSKIEDFDDVLIDEGFAEWIRHKIHIKVGDTKGARLIEMRKDIYGAGFKKITAVESKSGVKGVFNLFNRADSSYKE